MSGPSTIAVLPPEIIGRLVGDLHHLDDFLALYFTCRQAKDSLDACAPGDLLALCYRSRTTFFRPDPHFLLSALISAIRQYTCSSAARHVEVKRAIWHGCEGLLEWACHTPAIARNASWSLRSIHELWEWWMRVLNPLSDLVDRCVGDQWYKTPDFWSGGVEDAYTITAEPEKQVFQLQMYGDMFGTLMGVYLEPAAADKDTQDLATQALSVSLRLDFVKYLLPDWLVRQPAIGEYSVIPSAYPASPTDYFVSHDLPTTVARGSRVHPLRAVQTSFGPYVDDDFHESQKALLHLLARSPLWNSLVATIRARCGDEFHVPLPEPGADEPPANEPPTDEPPADEEDEEASEEFADADEDEDPDAEDDYDGADNDVQNGDEEQDSEGSDDSDFIPPVHYTVAVPSDDGDGGAGPTPTREAALWKQEMWEACPYALGGRFLEMLAEVWRVYGPQEVALLEMRRIARAHDRGKHEEPYDKDAHVRLESAAERARTEIEESGEGWDVLRRWRRAISELPEDEPRVVKVGACVTHEGYPDFVGDMAVATRDSYGLG